MGPPRRWRCSTRLRDAPATTGGIWVTDLMLRQAIERYQYRSFVSFHRLGSHESPLERQRRLGRRHMAGIMPVPQQVNGSTWYFELLGSKGEWQWSPPTSQALRRAREQEWSWPNLQKRLIDWLEDSNLGEPFLTPPTVSTTGMSSAIQTLREDILQLERNQDGKLPLENIKQLITIYCLDLDTYISNGNFTIDELLFAFHPMDEATSARVGTKSVANEIEICIRQQIMSSLAAALNSNPTSLHEEAWTAVSEMIFAMPPTLSAFRASRYFIRITGEVLKRNIDLDWLLRLTRAFLIHQQRANCKAGPWPIRMARFAQAIAHICPAQKKELWAALQDLSRLGGTKRHVDHALHILLLAAHDPLWSRKDFAEAARDYVARFGPFRERYVWMLTVARLLARDAISDQGHRTLIRASHESRTAVWVSISASVIERKPQNLHDMIDWLQDIDGLDSFVWDLARSYIYHGSHVPPLVLTTLIEYPNSNKEVVWSILDAMGTLERSRGDLSTKKTLQLIDAVALRVEQGSNFSDRQAVRQITRAVHMQRKVSGRATPSVLASLADVATRDLQKGGWGRTQRLDMLVQTIESEQGLETARKARQQLLGWRSMIHERNWAMRRSRQRNAGREGDSTTVETH